MYQHFIIPYLYKVQHVSGETPPIIRTLKLHWQPLVFYTWKVFGRVCGGHSPPNTHPTTFHVWKTRGCQCSFRLLMMGGVSPETCWASYKYWMIKFQYIVASCWIFLHEFRIYDSYSVSPGMKSRPIDQLQSYWDFYAFSPFLQPEYDILN
jgi:hypothetical protein